MKIQCFINFPTGLQLNKKHGLQQFNNWSREGREAGEGNLQTILVLGSIVIIPIISSTLRLVHKSECLLTLGALGKQSL